MSDDNDNDGREIAANIFDKTSSAAAALASTLPAPANVAVGVAAAIAAAIAGLLRALGVDDVQAAIDALVEERDRGAITDEHVARDDSEIMAAVSELYADDDDAGEE